MFMRKLTGRQAGDLAYRLIQEANLPRPLSLKDVTEAVDAMKADGRYTRIAQEVMDA